MKGIILAGGSGTRLYPVTKWIENIKSGEYQDWVKKNYGQRG